MTIDRRISKTKEAIRKALINLLDNNEIEIILLLRLHERQILHEKLFTPTMIVMKN